MRKALAPIALLAAAAPALLAHPGHDGTGFTAGVAHPLLGLDHLLAMVAVGLMAVRCAGAPDGDRRALWQVPAAFLAAMGLGGLLAVAGVPLPGAEWGIALSVLVFGVMVALANAPRTGLACAVAALFAVMHGHAHVAGMGGASVATYIGGFLLTTGLLHAGGVLGGWWLAQSPRQAVLRLAGAAVAVAGLGISLLG